MLVIHLGALAGLILLPLPTWQILVGALALYFLGGLGTTVAYHRALAHRSVVLNPVVQHILIFFAMFNGSGSPITWVSNHRYHHAHSDTERDVSSPRHGGFWWAHLRWLWQGEPAQPAKYCPDLNPRAYAWWSHLQIPILALSVFGGLMLWPAYGLPTALVAALWLGPVRLVIALHVQCTVNSLCHYGKVTDEHGSGQNVWWMTPLHLGQGENWHANHHRRPTDPRLGAAWWQIDLGWATIRALGACGLASRIRTAKASGR
jgi:stearoyl-CoA desaturase (delta-9 desaturase)